MSKKFTLSKEEIEAGPFAFSMVWKCGELIEQLGKQHAGLVVKLFGKAVETKVEPSPKDRCKEEYVGWWSTTECMKASGSYVWIGVWSWESQFSGDTSFVIPNKKVIGQVLADKDARRAATMLKDHGWTESTGSYGQDFSKPFALRPGSLDSILNFLNPQIEAALHELKESGLPVIVSRLTT